MTHASRREVKAAKSLSIIVLFFMISWFPLYTINCVQAFCKTCSVSEGCMFFTIILTHLNSAINPFLYAYHMQVRGPVCSGTAKRVSVTGVIG